MNENQICRVMKSLSAGGWYWVRCVPRPMPQGFEIRVYAAARPESCIAILRTLTEVRGYFHGKPR